MRVAKNKMNNFIKSRPYLIWYIKDFEKLSPESIVEHTLNYGDWKDVKGLIAVLGIKRVAAIFRKQTKKGRRINYRPEILNYFQLYFRKYAQHSP